MPEGFRDGMKSVCYLCEDRHPACHDTCKAYLLAKQEHEEQKQMIKKNRDAYDNYEVYHYQAVQRAKKNAAHHGKSYDKKSYTR